ncbi:hypothetical protein [Streptomyces sp. NPDC018031]|uniref:hypothetical protein n=1 Tax=Streptomyces sp. NPDC018031 TaxID=3365033 RepID=UPI0037A71891
MRAMPIAAIAAALVLSLSACSDDSEGDAAACKKAIAEQMKAGAEGSKDKPASCKGLDDKTLERLFKEVISDSVKDIKVPTPEVPTPDIDVPTPDLDLPEVP